MSHKHASSYVAYQYLSRSIVFLGVLKVNNFWVLKLIHANTGKEGIFIPDTRVQIWVHVSHACVTEWSVCMFQTRISCQCWTRPLSRSFSPCRRSAPNVLSSSTSGEKHMDALQRYAHNIVLFLGHSFFSPRPTENLENSAWLWIRGSGFWASGTVHKTSGGCIKTKAAGNHQYKNVVKDLANLEKSSF